MPGLFQGLEIGRRALLTHQLNLQTIGHNIANVNTPGFSRQRVNITTTMPENNTIGSIGTGVTVSNIRQIRDLFLGQQYRQENKSLGEWSYKEKILTQIESQLNEPNDNTLSDLLNDFWSAWSDLSTTDSRGTLLAQTQLLTNGFHEVANQLNELRASIDNDILNYTGEINRLTSEIANLNHQIKKLEVGGDRANDLRDQRDRLLDELSSIVDVNTVEHINGELTVYLGSMSIVNGNEAEKIGARLNNVAGVKQHDLVWQGTTISLQNASGELKGLIEARDEIIPRYLDELNALAGTLVEQVNTIHRSGVAQDGSTSVDFFDPRFTDAANIRINATLELNPSKIVSSQSGKEGDNVIALAIANLQNSNVMNGGNSTMNDFYNSMIGSLGVNAKEASSFAANYELLVQQIDYARQSVQGVSLDEEMTNMVKYQRAYDAAARVITAMDEALETVISGMGIVGRY